MGIRRSDHTAGGSFTQGLTLRYLHGTDANQRAHRRANTDPVDLAQRDAASARSSQSTRRNKATRGSVTLPAVRFARADDGS